MTINEERDIILTTSDNRQDANIIGTAGPRRRRRRRGLTMAVTAHVYPKVLAADRHEGDRPDR